MNEIVGKFSAFRNEKELCLDKPVLVSINDVNGDSIEIAFSPGLPGNPHMYLEIHLSQLVQMVLACDDE